MDTINDKPPATLESVWEAFRETDRLIKESKLEMKESREKFELDLKKSREESELEHKKFKLELKESHEKFELELKKSREKFDMDLKKSREESELERKKSREESELERKKSREEFEQELKESREEFRQELKESRKEFDQRMGAWGNNFGAFTEEYFFNSFDNGKRNFFGEEFDEIEKNVKGIKKGYKDEYDFLMINGHSIGIVEAKFKAHENDIPKVLKKANTIRMNFPEFQNHKVYLGLASMAFYPKLEDECIKHGIAIVKQVGDAMVINDEHLKTF